MSTFFKKCPNCGKRFEVEHTVETVEKKEELLPEERTVFPVAGIASAYPIPVAEPPGLTTKVKEEEIVEDDIYTETYKCKHCGHVWTEQREKIKHLGDIEGVEGDI